MDFLGRSGWHFGYFDCAFEHLLVTGFCELVLGQRCVLFGPACTVVTRRRL